MRRIPVFLAVVFSALLLLSCGGGAGGGGGGGYDPPAGAKATLGDSTTIEADGALHANAEGVGVEAEASAMPAGADILLEASTMTGGPMKSLLKEYELLSDFYQVKAQGTSDSPGTVELVFSTDDPDARIMAFSGFYFSNMLDAVPSGGYVRVRVKAVPGVAPDSEISYAGDGDIRYVLVKPKGLGREALAYRSGAELFGEPVFTDCSGWSNCRKRNGKVQVTWYSDLGLSADEIDQALVFLEDSLDAYRDMGVSAADIDPSVDSPIMIHVTQPTGDPYYRVLLGGIVLASSDIKSLIDGDSKTAGTVLHELAHQLQAGKYAMIPAAVSGAKTWWIESTADNLAFRQLPEMVADHAEEYGVTEDESRVRYATQYAPFQWPVSEGYIHSQLLRMNLCSDVSDCPLSVVGMIDALNSGSFPFVDSADKRALLLSNMDEYSRYLLGLSPVSGNLADPPENIGEGFTIGDYIVGFRKSGSAYTQYDSNGYAPRISKSSGGVNISTTVEQNGVYALQVNNNGEKQFGTVEHAIPLALKVEAGHAPVRYRLNDSSEATLKSGGTAFVIQPITSLLGDVGYARLAALGDSQYTSFTARLEPVDLSGDWIAHSATITSWNLASSDESLVSLSQEDFIDYMKEITHEVGETGTYTRNEAGDAYAYVPSEAIDGGTVTTSAKVSKDKIEWTLKAAATPTSSRVPAAGRAPVLPFSFPGVVWDVNRLKLNTLATATSLEYVANDSDPGAPLWRLEGTATTTVDGSFKMQKQIDEDTWEYVNVTLTGPVTYDFVAYIYNN